MHPQLNVFGLSLSSYYVLYFFAFLTVFLCVIFIAPKHGIKREHIVRFLIIAFCVSLIGVRLSYFFTDGLKKLVGYYIYHNRSKPTLGELFFGTKFIGSLLFSFLAAVLYTKYANIKTYDFIALILIYMPLGLGIGRVGCFLNGCCYGVSYHGIFAVNFPHAGYCHPLQLYETVWDFMTFAALFILNKKKAQRKTIIAVFVILSAGIRFISEYLRADANWTLKIVSANQLLMLITAAVMVIYIIHTKNKEVKVNEEA